jgi:hypothetical protein
MINNTKNNHLRYWFNSDDKQQWRSTDDDTTSMSVGGCSRPIKSLADELIMNCESILDDFPDLTLFMSGGLDSEMAFRSFERLGKIPEIAIIRLRDGANQHDIQYAVRLLDNLGIGYQLIDFDLVEFYRSGECWEVANRYQSYTVYQQMILRIAEQHGGPMLTVDEVELQKYPRFIDDVHQFKFEWVFMKKEDQDGVWRRFVDRTDIPALNNFFTYSPESMLAFLQNPVVAELIRDGIPGKLGWNSSKNRIYSDLGYQFIPRPKFGGIERHPNIWEDVKSNIHLNGLEFYPREYVISALELEQNLINGIETTCTVN